MKRFALALAIVFSSTALAFAAAPGDSGPETKSAKAAKASKIDRAAKSRKAADRAKSHASPAREGAQEDTRPGDITITGKAGSVTQISYGHGAKSEPVKAAGQ